MTLSDIIAPCSRWQERSITQFQVGVTQGECAVFCAPSPQGFSEMTWSNDGSDVDTCDEEHPRGRLLWRHVRTIVQGVRGEGSGLEGTVRHRAARSAFCCDTCGLEMRLLSHLYPRVLCEV